MTFPAPTNDAPGRQRVSDDKVEHVICYHSPDVSYGPARLLANFALDLRDARAEIASLADRLDALTNLSNFWQCKLCEAETEIASLKRQIEEAGWRPIETAPKDGKEFLACNVRQGGTKILLTWSRVHQCWFSKGVQVHTQATHWMPLPAPPAAIRARKDDAS